MGTREVRAERGRRLGRDITTRMLGELRSVRLAADVSQRGIAAALGWSQSEYARFERGLVAVSLIDLASVASVLGMEVSARLYLIADPLRDRGHQALIGRFRAMLSEAWRVVAEVPLPNPGDPRAWDLLLRLPEQLVGVEAETRIRDMQRLVRHIHQRARDGGADVVVLLLADTRENRALLPELLVALGSDYATPPRHIFSALRAGQPLRGSGVVLV